MENQEVEKAQQRSGLFLLRDILLDLIFPPSCLRCGRVDWHFCEACQAILRDLPNAPVFADLPAFAGLIATGKHEGILQEAVQALKYQQALSLAPLLAERMAKSLEDSSWTFDIVIPVPISSLRLKERGYNQAKEISHYLAQQLNIPHQPEALEKIRHTQSQVGLSQTERLSNIKEAFSADSSLLKGKTLLLVDDVRSTGATLVECAQTAINAGASAVYAITVTTASI
jgi:competence protein ComFC